MSKCKIMLKLKKCADNKLLFEQKIHNKLKLRYEWHDIIYYNKN